MDAAVSALDQLARQRTKLESQIHAALQEVEEVENVMKQVMVQGDAEMIAKAESYHTRKSQLEDAINKLSMQKNVLIGQQMEEVPRYRLSEGGAVAACSSPMWR